ncbi:MULTISPECIES: hypothetical protein [unclassified Rhizobium]|uniref:hypothetical protein n=1 Tax=unclassified Rhizobium TaxID=2613769 RepID=UPI001AE93163|nr:MULTISPECIES: hypothetical protein [unclassified Rhizobium]MBP2459579.1 hypothetical protein [Rhizobium sp. PvP014]MBP2531873.1 hypothetical protein [Rhizobium sp. PvP099]
MPVAVVGFIASLGVPGLIGAGGALTFAGNLVAGAIGLGISFAANALFGPKPSNLKPQDVKSTLRQSVLPRRKHRGMVMTSGGFAFYRSRNGGLYMVIYLGEGPSTEFVQHYIDDRQVELDANGYIQGKPIKGKIRIETRAGLPIETHYQSIATVFPEIWGVNHRGDGCISVAITARGAKQEDFNSIYPNRIPQYKGLRRDGAALDPRTNIRAWTSNLNLIYLDYLSDADGAGISADYFDADDFAVAADVADEILQTNGAGTVHRYHGQLSYDLTTEPSDIIERLETATDSRIYLKSNGKIGIHPGVWVEPTVRIHDGCINNFEMSDSSGPLREANEVTLEYTNPLAGYSSSSCDPWRDEVDISAQGTRTIPIEAYEIQNHHHGRRVQKLKYERASARWQGKIITDLWGIQARGERRILLEIKELGIDFQPFEIEDYQEDDETMTVMMEVRSCRPSMYSLSSQEEGTPPPVPPSTEESDLDPPSNLVVIGGQRKVSGNNKVPVITATWDPYPDRDDLTAYAQISVADQNKWNPMSLAKNGLGAEALGLEDGALYDVAVEWRKVGGTVSEQALVENTRAIADADKPAMPIELQAPVSGLTVTVSARAFNDNTAYLSFRRGTALQTFDQATDISGNLRVTANEVRAFADNPGIGTWRYWALSTNGSGVKSDMPAGPVTVSVT